MRHTLSSEHMGPYFGIKYERWSMARNKQFFDPVWIVPWVTDTFQTFPEKGYWGSTGNTWNVIVHPPLSSSMIGYLYCGRWDLTLHNCDLWWLDHVCISNIDIDGGICVILASGQTKLNVFSVPTMFAGCQKWTRVWNSNKKWKVTEKVTVSLCLCYSN